MKVLDITVSNGLLTFLWGMVIFIHNSRLEFIHTRLIKMRELLIRNWLPL